MGVLATTLTVLSVIQCYILPPMTVTTGFGKLAKSEANWTIVSELIGELMFIVGLFLAIIYSHSTWQLRTTPADPDSENQLIAEEEIIVLGLAWDRCAAPRY